MCVCARARARRHDMQDTPICMISIPCSMGRIAASFVRFVIRSIETVPSIVGFDVTFTYTAGRLAGVATGPYVRGGVQTMCR